MGAEPADAASVVPAHTGGAAVLLAGAAAALVWVNVDARSYARVWSTQLSIHLAPRRPSASISPSTRVDRPRTAGVPRCRPTRRSRSVCSRSSGRTLPDRLRAFLLTVVIADDLIGLVVIVVAYTGSVAAVPLIAAIVFYGVAVVIRVLVIHRGVLYLRGWRLRLGVPDIHGPVSAPVTVAEYGDFECPFCGQAEPVLRELLRDFADVRYVWRHLPLTDVHLHAQPPPRQSRRRPNKARSGRCTTFSSTTRTRSPWTT